MKYRSAYLGVVVVRMKNVNHSHGSLHIVSVRHRVNKDDRIIPLTGSSLVHDLAAISASRATE